MWAAQARNLDAVQILLKYGADVNARNNDGKTAFDWVDQGRYKEIIQILLNKRTRQDKIKRHSPQSRALLLFHVISLLLLVAPFKYPRN